MDRGANRHLIQQGTDGLNVPRVHLTPRVDAERRVGTANQMHRQTTHTREPLIHVPHKLDIHIPPFPLGITAIRDRNDHEGGRLIEVADHIADTVVQGRQPIHRNRSGIHAGTETRDHVHGIGPWNQPRPGHLTVQGHKLLTDRGVPIERPGGVGHDTYTGFMGAIGCNGFTQRPPRRQPLRVVVRLGLVAEMANHTLMLMEQGARAGVPCPAYSGHTIRPHMPPRHVRPSRRIQPITGFRDIRSDHRH